MNSLILSDREYQTDIFESLTDTVRKLLKEKGFTIEEIQIGCDDLTYCRGCFGCWVIKPGECVHNDMMSRINQAYINSDVTIYLSPIVFGQASANIKNALDRWLPNILPFFKKRPDGSTTHPPRYKEYPKQILIGYADDLTDDDASLFTDIIKKHRNDMELLVYRGDNSALLSFFNGLDLRKAGIMI